MAITTHLASIGPPDGTKHSRVGWWRYDRSHHSNASVQLEGQHRAVVERSADRPIVRAGPIAEDVTQLTVSGRTVGVVG